MADTRKGTVYNSCVADPPDRFGGKTNGEKTNLYHVLGPNADGVDGLDPDGMYVGRVGPAFVTVGGKKFRFPQRASKYANPYPVKKGKYTREESIAKYNEWLIDQVRADPHFLDDLVGKNLYCWCEPEACHAHSLRDAVYRLYVEKQILPMPESS